MWTETEGKEIELGVTVVYGNGVDTCAEVLVPTSTGKQQTREYWRMIYLQWLTGSEWIRCRYAWGSGYLIGPAK